MNDDDPTVLLAAMKAEHRRLDAEIDRLESLGEIEPIALARLKKAKLRLKDDIAAMTDEMIPDIIA